MYIVMVIEIRYCKITYCKSCKRKQALPNCFWLQVKNTRILFSDEERIFLLGVQMMLNQKKMEREINHKESITDY